MRLLPPLTLCAPFEHKDGDTYASCWSVDSRDQQDKIMHSALVKYIHSAGFQLALESDLRYGPSHGLAWHVQRLLIYNA